MGFIRSEFQIDFDWECMLSRHSEDSESRIWEENVGVLWGGGLKFDAWISVILRGASEDTNRNFD